MPLDVTFQPRHESPAPEPGRLNDGGPLQKMFPNHKNRCEKPNKFSGGAKWLPKGSLAVDLWQMPDNKSMFKAQRRPDSSQGTKCLSGDCTRALKGGGYILNQEDSAGPQQRKIQCSSCTNMALWRMIYGGNRGDGEGGVRQAGRFASAWLLVL